MKVSIITLGCRINQAESGTLEQKFQQAGHQIAQLSDKPDLCIINTCSVTVKADAQSRHAVSRCMKTGARVIVTGCYAELKADELRERFGPSVLVVANAEKGSIAADFPCSAPHPGPKTVSRMRPIVKVQDGCNNSCSYCIIPQARGASRSFDLEGILEEINRLHEQGFQEVVLSGIHLGTYGKEMRPARSLFDLLKAVLDATVIPRIRLSSLEINELDTRTIDIITSSGRICRHLHIPLQSGSDNILFNMNRHYRVRDYVNTIEMLAARHVSLGIGTDIIVGFPGETEADFQQTYSTVETLPFSYAHVFPYSPRPGTRAASLSGRIASVLVKERVNRLRCLADRKRAAFIGSQLGSIHQVVVEDQHQQGYSGTTSNYIKVRVVDAYDARPGMLADIQLRGVEGGFATGVAVNK